MKNILVIDPSIMIHKIVQLAFPETEHNLILSDNYPLERQPEEPLSLILLSADLPNQEDVFAIGGQLKQQYNCPVLMMIPKFFEFDTGLIGQNGLDGAIEKPFTSDTLKEKCGALESNSEPIDELDGLSPEELESITEEEFMLSEEDLVDIGEEDLSDIEIPDIPLEGEEPETADMGEIPAPKPISTEDFTGTPIEETAPKTDPIEKAPFEDMEMDEDLDSIDFGDLEDGESLLDTPVPDQSVLAESDNLSEEDTVSITEQELAKSDEEPAIPEVAEAPFAGEVEKEAEDFGDMTEETFPTKEENIIGEEEVPVASEEVARDFDIASPETSHEDFGEMAEETTSVETEEGSEKEEVLETEDEKKAGFGMEEPESEVGPLTIREAVQFKGETEIPAPEPEKVLEEAEGEPLDDLFVEELNPSTPETDVEPELAESEDLPDVNFAIEEEPQTVHVDEYQIEAPLAEPEAVKPLDVSFADEDAELIPAPSALSTEGLGTSSNLSDADIQKIAERVVAMLSDKAVRDIAWEVIPVVAEEIVRSRIRQLENEEVE